MEARRRAPPGPGVGRPPHGAGPLELVLCVWHFLRLLFSGVATLAVYMATPVTWLRAYPLAARRPIQPHPPPQTQSAASRSVGKDLAPPSRWLLPPVPPCDLGKMTVVLDLDETLISSRQARGHAGCQRTGAARSVELDCDGSSEGKSSRVVMFMRPGLFEFLSRLSAFAEVVLFTAGVPAYAQPLADALDPSQRFFAARLYREDTVSTVWHSYVKDLSKLGRDLRRTVLVDNSPYSFLLQPANGIPCVPFRGAGGDQQLLKVILPLLECLSYLNDIRPVLNNHFKMASWFRARGCNVELDF